MTLVISKMKSQFNNKKNQVLVTHFAVSPHNCETFKVDNPPTLDGVSLVKTISSL